MPFPRFCLLLLCLLFTLRSGHLAQANVPALHASGERVLFLGDSLTVGPFGDSLQNYLIDTFSDRGVGVIAVCGCSPEHWLGDEATFSSRCGYRLKKPGDLKIGRYENGVPPKSYAVPKVETILRAWRPSVVIVQLGTNWFDRLSESSSEQTLANFDQILDRFVKTIRTSPSQPSLIWITPPDSSRFRKVQGLVTRAIKQASVRNRFRVIDSTGMIYYEPGKSGGDGVHLSTNAADIWADKVKRKLGPFLGESISASN